MADNRRFFVITAQGEQGPFTTEDLLDEIKAKRIDPNDLLRTAFGANLGPVGQVLGLAKSRSKKTTSDRQPIGQRRPAPQKFSSAGGIPWFPIVLGVLAAIFFLVVLGNRPPPVETPYPTPATPRITPLSPGTRAEPSPIVPDRKISTAINPLPLPLSSTIGPPPTAIPTAPPQSQDITSTPPPKAQAVSRPYAGTPQNLPGPLNVWMFDEGGEGVAYHDEDTELHTNVALRPEDGVDFWSSNLFPDTAYLAWVRDGEWLNFTCQIESPGSYDWSFLGGRHGNSEPIQLSWWSNDHSLGPPVVVTDTGESNFFEPFHGSVTLPAGTHTLQLRISGTNLDFGKIVFTQSTTPAP